MKRLYKQLLIGTLITATGIVTMAQGNPTSPAGPAANEARGVNPRMERGDPERFQKRMSERHTKHLASLKSKLQLSAEQDGAWTTFSNAMKPPASSPNRMGKSEMEKLSTPERIDLMRSRMAEREAAMRQRGDATKVFYAALNAEQKKTFDKETLPRKPHWQQYRP